LGGAIPTIGFLSQIELDGTDLKKGLSRGQNSERESFPSEVGDKKSRRIKAACSSLKGCNI